MPNSRSRPLQSTAEQLTANLFAPAIVALLGSAVVITLIGQYTDLDLLLADLYYDPVRHEFPWNTTWFAKDFMHGWVKNALRWAGFLLVAATLVDFFRPLRRSSPNFSAQLRAVTLASLLEPLLIQTLKESSNMHCPWAVDRFGGPEPFLRLLDWVPPGWNAGHCFPAGHASTAMWLCALAVFWLPKSPKKAFLVFLGGLLAGFFLGWVQQMRGQHFLTHTLWTAWLASAIFLLLIGLFSRQLLAPRTEPQNPPMQMQAQV